MLGASLPTDERPAQPPPRRPRRAQRVAADVTDLRQRHPADEIIRADGCVPPLEADRGVDDGGADGDDDEKPTRPENACHLAQCDEWRRQVFEHVRAEHSVEFTVTIRQAARVGLLELRGNTDGRQVSGGVVKHL